MALSGGPDSCALLLALVEAADAGLPVPRPIAAAHFHHGLRGADADEDAAFSAVLAERLGIVCRVVRGSVPKNTGRSPNDAARRARYAFLEETARDFGATHVATGHTADDQAETVLGRVLRGTSVDGLAGIPAYRRLTSGITLVRPMLSQSRADVEAYCKAQGVVPRRDPSNEKDRYARSRLRKRLPELAEQFNPQLASALNRLAANAAADSDYLNAQAAVVWTRAAETMTAGSVRFDAALLSREHPAIRRRVLLQGILHAAEVAGTDEDAATMVWVEALDALLSSSLGKPVTLPGRIRAERTLTYLILTPAAEEAKQSLLCPLVPLPLPGTTEVFWADLTITTRFVPPEEAPTPRQRRASVIDIALSADAPLVVRTSDKGERMAPLGMNGRTRLIRDLLADAKIPAAERDSTPVIARADTGEILWLVGIAQSESTRVRDDDPKTGSVLRLSAEKGHQRLFRES
ncbi:MAG: tRNA lysidine(34) synthetase TilS [Armatimonadota bacterium]